MKDILEQFTSPIVIFKNTKLHYCSDSFLSLVDSKDKEEVLDIFSSLNLNGIKLFVGYTNDGMTTTFKSFDNDIGPEEQKYNNYGNGKKRKRICLPERQILRSAVRFPLNWICMTIFLKR